MTDAGNTTATASAVSSAVVVPFPRHRVQQPAGQVGPVKCCPTCHTELDGGPIHFYCWPCGRAVIAADVPTEFGSNLRGAA